MRTSRAFENRLGEFASDVRAGLSKPQKELHSKYLYDELGSALFEAITHLPEYALTRADERLLRAHADEIAALIPPAVDVIELGSGMGRKTRPILSALHRSSALRYFPIDVSAEALARCERELAGIAEIHPRRQLYLDGMASAVCERRPGYAWLLLFLGSTIGNFERPCAIEFLRDLRRCLEPGDALLVGADLVKERDRMLAAYDDPTGVTAAFNLNLLGRINRELGGNFELRAFEHQARWNERENRIEMHLVSLSDQTAFIAACDFEVRLRAGETIWTESSHKFQAEEMFAMAAQCGFRVAAQWVDHKWPFVESLWTAR
ncbi:MAG TPA: L-histidine N(alpha)-methyltransferase [Bryobacteraceae bacterium]|nr:L-histidine N(alpha)-methyltransferase [Bryobacteraceae bacterium]